MCVPAYAAATPGTLPGALGDQALVAFAMSLYVDAGQTAAAHVLYREATQGQQQLAPTAAMFKQAFLASRVDGDAERALAYYADLKRLGLPLFVDMSDTLFVTVRQRKDHAAMQGPRRSKSFRRGLNGFGGV